MTLIAPWASKSRTRIAALSLLLGLSAALAMGSLTAPAYGSVAQEQREGQQILRSVDGGDRRCADLSNADFERVGEYVMGRMAGSTRAHEQMNQLMSNMMEPVARSICTSSSEGASPAAVAARRRPGSVR